MVRTSALLALVTVAAAAAPARADQCLGCKVLAVSFTTEASVASTNRPAMAPQIVAWLETPAGAYVETSLDGAPLYITQQTGSFGIGNRPGRLDFNSGPLWPYGRREGVFPIWAHRHAATWGTFPRVVFQSGSESDLSHSMNRSSAETHFCRPLHDAGTDKQYWDTGTCASQSYTDKGVFSTTEDSLYPPRIDVVQSVYDSPDVGMYGVLNTFDAVSQATPRSGSDTVITWSIPPDFAPGNYVLWVEVSKEFDFNDTYNAVSFPSPDVAYGDYGLPYRGQPSVVYRVPITVSPDAMMAQVSDYAGYGDPDGADGMLRPPDTSISNDVPGSGSSRLALESDYRGTYRVRAEVAIDHDCVAPGVATALQYVGTTGRTSSISFVAPGDDGDLGTAQGYEVRYRVGDDIVTEADFDAAAKLTTSVVPEPGGATQVMPIDTLLPETEYVVAVRAYDNCYNKGAIASLRFTTPPQQTGEVDACFVATAAYGSLMANDVGMLRRFRDVMLRNSAVGELLVESYYTFGPAVAGVVGESDLLRATARDALGPLVARIQTLRF